MGQRYVGFLIRLVAKIIDWLILFVLLLPTYLISFLITGDPATENLPTLSMVYAVIWFVILILYDIYFIKKYNATPGKMVMGIKVLRIDNSNITWGTSILRWFIYKLGSGWWVLFLGVLWIIWDDKKQGWHDKAAKTIVIYK
ncbi:MAG: RDD family protein [Patescibacteria group bacterium]